MRLGGVGDCALLHASDPMVMTRLLEFMSKNEKNWKKHKQHRQKRHGAGQRRTNWTAEQSLTSLRCAALAKRRVGPYLIHLEMRVVNQLLQVDFQRL